MRNGSMTAMMEQRGIVRIVNLCVNNNNKNV